MSIMVLFLCTGNYYRSRYAEILFNELAGQAALDARAISCGVATELGVNNVGPISAHTLKRLTLRSIRNDSTERFPRQVQDQDFRDADLIIALDEAEHRPIMQQRFPQWAARTEYWSVGDLWTDTPPDEALRAIEIHVHKLIDRLKNP